MIALHFIVFTVVIVFFVKQCRSATTLCFLTLLAVEFDTVIDRGVAIVGHGKSLVDATNGVSKNITLRASSRNVKDAADAGKDDKTSLAVHKCDQWNGRVSPAEDCKVFLEEHFNQERRKRKKNEGHCNGNDMFFMFKMLSRN